jgi:hypothetical protein
MGMADVWIDREGKQMVFRTIKKRVFAERNRTAA